MPDAAADGAERHDMPSGDTVWYRDSNHEYNASPEFKRSERIAGISTLAKNDGQPGADGLMDWAARLTCEGVAQEFAKRVGSELWLRSGPEIAQTIKENRLDWRGIRDQAGERGTISHNVLQELSEDVMPALRSGHDHAVVDWWKKTRPDPVYVEQVVYDAERAYAGRFDLMFGHSNPTLLDLKTGSVRNAALIQLNLYALGCRAAGLIVPTRLVVLDTHDDGSWAEIEVPLNPGWALAALATHRNGQEMRRVLTQSRKTASKGAAVLEAAA